MTCRELAALLHDHLEGELPARRSTAVTLHLLICRACRAYAGSYRTTVQLARSCADAELGGEELEGLVRAVLSARHRPD